jgi:hypothetical protein
VTDPGPVPATSPGPGRTSSDRGLRGAWRGWAEDPVDRFGVVLVLVVATIIVSALVEVGDSWRSSLIVTTTMGAAIVTTTRAVGLHPSRRRVAFVLVVAVLFINAALAVLEATVAADVARVGSVGLLWLILVLVVPILVIRRIFAHRVVAMRTVIGAVAAYLQIAVAYSVLFQALDTWTATPFFGTEEPSTAYMYVSLTTIATLGLGDLAPVGNLPRLVLSSEAVLGQVFLVTVVAVVVSRFAESHRAP